jgi:ABC-2 type transport system permease protein
MITILIVARHHLLRLFRRPALVLFLAAVPLTLAFVESAAFGPPAGPGTLAPVPILLVDEDRTSSSQALGACVTDGIGKDPVAVSAVETTEKASQLYRSGEYAAMIVVPAGFEHNLRGGSQPNVEIASGPPQNRLGNVARNVLESCVMLANQAIAKTPPGEPNWDYASVAKAAAAVTMERPPANPRPAGAASNDFFAAIFPGLGIFGILIISQAMAGQLLRDRSHAVYRRLLAMPVRAANVFGGGLLYLASGLTALWALVSSFGALAFHLRLQAVPALLVFGAGFSVCAGALQLLIGASAKSERGAQSISAIAVMLLAIFGGAFVPVDNYPQPWRVLATLLPNGAAQAGMSRILISGWSAGAAAVPLFAVWAWAAALSLFAIYQWRRTAAP